MIKFIKRHKKGTTITGIVILVLAILAVTTLIIVNKMVGNIKPPDEISASEDFEYDTLDALKVVFAVPEEEKNLTINDYAENEAFKVYRRAYNKFLNTPDYFITTQAFTDAGGIYVNITNEKKFDGTNFYMHAVSLARDGGMFSSASDGNSKHYLYVGDNGNNYATVVRLDPHDDSKVLKEKVFTEKDYVFNYGSIPYAVCNYLIRENTIASSEFTFDQSTGFYKVHLVLDPVPASINMIKNMAAMSGTEVTYKDGLIDYTVYMNEDFTIRKVTVLEKYTVKAMGVSMTATAGLNDTYYYAGEEGYQPLSEDEKYDLTNIPVEENQEEISAAKNAMSIAVDKIVGSGVNSDISLSLSGNKVLDGRIQIIAKDYTVIELETALGGKNITAHVQLNEDKSGNVIVDADGLKLGFTFDNLGQFVKKIIDKLGIDLGGISSDTVATIADNIDIKGIITGLKNAYGKQQDGVFKFEANLNEISNIPLDVPFDIVVRDNTIESFKINNKNIMGAVIGLSLTPSDKALTATKRGLTADVADLSSLIDGGLDVIKSLKTEGSVVSELIKLVKGDKISLSGTVVAGGKNITIDGVNLEDVSSEKSLIKAIKNGTLNASGTIGIDGANIGIAYVNDVLYVDYNGKVQAKMNKATVNHLIQSLVNNYSDILTAFEMNDVKEIIDKLIELDFANLPIANIITAIKELSSNNGEIFVKIDTANIISGIDFGVIEVRLYKENGALKVGVKVGDKMDVTLALSGEKFTVSAPQGDYIDLSNVKYIDFAVDVIKSLKKEGTTVNNIYKQFNQKYFNLSLNVVAGDKKVSLENVKIVNNGDLKDPTGAFNKGLLDISGRIKLGNTTLDVIYVNNTLFASYNGAINLKMSRTSLDDVWNLISANFKQIVERLNYSNVLDGIEAVKKLKNASVADLFGMLKDLSLSDNKLVLYIDGTSIGMEEITVQVGTDESGNLALSGNIGTDGSISLTMNNQPFEALTEPQGEYMDFSNAKYLVEGLVNAILKDPCEYYLSGSANMKFAATKVNIAMTVSARLVDKTGGGKAVEVVVTLSNMDTTLGSSIIQNYLKYGKSTMIFKDNNVYIERENYEYKWFKLVSKGTEYRKMTIAYFGNDIMQQLGFFMGLSDSLMGQISSGKTIKIEELFKSYSGNDTVQSIELDGKAIDSMIGTIKANVSLAEVNGVRQLTKLDVVLPITFIGIGLDMNMSFDHHLDMSGNYDEIAKINEKYGSVELLELAA